MDFKEKDILLICTAHQVNDDRVNHLIKNFEILKEQKLDICLATHSNYGIERITDYCDYLVYDKDNYFPTLQDMLNNLDKINFSKLNAKFHSYFNINFNGIETFINTYFWESHSRSALANFKNGIDIALSRNYKWIVYLEYDTILPEINLREYFLDKISEIEAKNKNGHGYFCEDSRHPLIWPLFFITKTNVFTSNEDFMSDWQKSIPKYLETFGNKSFEEIIDNVLKNNEIIVNNAFSINSDMGYSIEKMEELSIFHQRDLPCNKFNPSDYYYMRLFAKKNDDNKFNLEFWCIIKEKIQNETDVRIKILEDEKIFKEFKIIDTHIPSWRFQPLYDNIDSSIDKKIKFEILISFEDKEDYIFSYYFNLKNIEKYYYLFNRI